MYLTALESVLICVKIKICSTLGMFVNCFIFLSHFCLLDNKGSFYGRNINVAYPPKLIQHTKVCLYSSAVFLVT